LANATPNQFYPFTYTISTANTWEQKSITIPASVTGTWNSTNGQGLQVEFSLGAGATYSGTASAWTSSVILQPTGSTSVVGTNGATWSVTGVQLEKGSTATSFDYRPYGTEFALCQRYYQSNRVVWSGYISGSGPAFYAYSTFKVTMRASATGTITGESLASINAGSLSNGATDSIRYDIIASGANTQGYAFATINASAEL
jgi:hypothetical protein